MTEHFLNLGRGCIAFEDMADFVAPEYSKSRVVAAGKRLKERDLPWPSDETLETFKIAHNWRACHILPMRHLRAELSGKVKRAGGGLTAARIKRMSSIRAKLRRNPRTLYQMQDIAGCRAIMPGQDEADHLVALFRQETRHTFVDQDDYIAMPKQDGYRGHHLIYRYQGEGDFAALNSNAQYVEIQIRTKLQHAWATAVEAVGMVRSEELKAGSGSPDWLRLFALMGAEFAAKEYGNSVPNTPDAEVQRRGEIIELDRKLSALSNLANYRNAVKIAETAATHCPYYLIQFDRQAGRLHVTGITATASVTSLDEAEKSGRFESVLVAVDKVGDLRAAYPNYFMDVAIFEEHLRQVVEPPVVGPRLKVPASINFDWLKNWNRRGG